MYAPMITNTEEKALALSAIVGETVSVDVYREFVAWLKSPGQEDLKERLSGPVLFHPRAIGDRHKVEVEAWEKWKESRK